MRLDAHYRLPSPSCSRRDVSAIFLWSYLSMLSSVAKYFQLENSYVFYGSYHHERRNKIVHILFVPVIFTSSLAFLSLIPITESINAAHAVVAAYATSFIAMEPIAGALYVPLMGAMLYIAQHICTQNLVLTAIVNVVSWAAQVLSHRFFEERSPAFTEDPLQAIHAAVFFVWLEVLYSVGYRQKTHRDLEARVRERISEMDCDERATSLKAKKVQS